MNLIVAGGNHPPYETYDDPRKVSGLLAPYREWENYFIFRKFNITFKSVPGGIQAKCYESGRCDGPLERLQANQADYAGVITEFQVVGEPMNLTFGSVLGESLCSLFYRPQIDINLTAQDFMAALSEFDYRIWIIALIFAFLLGFLMPKVQVIIEQLKHYGLPQVLYESLFAQSFQKTPLITVRICSLSLVLLILLIDAIFSASYQTGLLVTRKYVKLDSWEDVIHNGVKPVFYRSGYCRFAVESSSNPVFQKIVARRKIAKFIFFPLEKRFEDFFIPKQVVLALNTIYTPVKLHRCLVRHQNEFDHPIYISNKPIVHMKNHFVMSAFSKSNIKEKALKLAYAAFETSNVKNHAGEHLFAKSASGFFDKLQGVDHSCVRDKAKSEGMITTPLSVRNLRSAFVILSLFGSIATLIFTVEHLQCLKLKEK